jgi:hypothetical protein
MGYFGGIRHRSKLNASRLTTATLARSSGTPWTGKSTASSKILISGRDPKSRNTSTQFRTGSPPVLVPNQFPTGTELADDEAAPEPEPVPPRTPTSTEKAPQRKEVGGKKNLYGTERDSVAARSPARHVRRRRQVHHQASEGRARREGMASRDGSLDPGRDVGRSDDVCAHRRHEGLEPPR